MNGRLEHELQTNERTKKLLKELPDYVTSYYMHIQSSKSANTSYTYVNTVKRFMEYIGNMNINNVTEDTVQKFLESIKYINNNGKLHRSSVSYTKLSCSSLSSFFLFLYRKGIIDSNPMEFIEMPIRKDSVKRVFFSMDDLRSLLFTVTDSNRGTYTWLLRDYTILYLFMVTGMRKTALSEINVEDLDLNNNTLKIIDKRDKEHIYILPDDVKEVLAKWLVYRRRYMNEQNFEIDALFISKKHNRLSPNAIYKTVRYYTEKAFGKAYSPHKLRAAFVSLYYEETHDIEAVRDAVGHADTQTTSRYIVKNNNPRKEAAKFISNGIRGK